MNAPWLRRSDRLRHGAFCTRVCDGMVTILTIFVGVLTGSIIGIVLMARQRDRNMQMLLPFGIFLGVGAIFSLLFGVHIVEWYAGQFR